jgi:K+-sensing histidine kinase KdpD
MGWKIPERLPRWLRPVVGVLLSVGAAYGAALAFAGRDLRIVLPLWFVAVLVVLGMRYGMAVGIIGSLLSAVIFAHMLFAPLGSFRIGDEAARQNLAWMVLGGIALSYLLAPSDSAPKSS